MCHGEDGTILFQEWLFQVLDRKTRARIEARIDRLEDGNFGDVEPIGEGISELRLDFGPGYRIYFGQQGLEIHLIRGGTKRTQSADIAAAKAFWRTHDRKNDSLP
jgi:putative addiction module killer protein